MSGERGYGEMRRGWGVTMEQRRIQRAQRKQLDSVLIKSMQDTVISSYNSAGFTHSSDKTHTHTHTHTHNLKVL